MKRMGAPLNTPVTNAVTSRVVGKHWSELGKHVSLLEDVTKEWLAEVQLGLPGEKNWALLNRRVQKAGKVFKEANKAACRIAGAPSNTAGMLTDEQEATWQKNDEVEFDLMSRPVV